MPFGKNPNDPWYYNSLFQIGPFTGSDQSNAAADARRQQIMRQNAAGANNAGSAFPMPNEIPGLPSLVYPAQPNFNANLPAPPVTNSAVTDNPPFAENDRQVQAGVAGTQAPAPAGPGFFDYWGTPPKGEAKPDDPYKYRFFTFLNPSEDAPAGQTDQNAPADPTLPDTAPIPFEPPSEEAPDQVKAPAAAAANPNDVNQDTMSFVKNIMDAMGYPSAPSSDNAKQAAADAYAAHEMDRTRLLAQLAFASGLTASAGGAYTEIGKGFAAAGQTYDKGFGRYQKALQSSADRYTDSQNAQYAYQAKKSGVMADLYTAGEKQKLQQQKLVQDAAKQRSDTIDTMFKKELDNQKNEMGITDPNATADIMKRWQLSRQAGEYIPSITDVTK
jgi:hypothetical protein